MCARNFAVLHGHAVGIAREAQRQQRHVQQAVAEAAQLLQPRGAVAAENANGLLGGEAVVTGGNRRVRGEDALAAHLLDVGLGGRAQRSAAQLPLQQRQRQQRRVAFVHVVDVYTQAQRVGHAHAAHAQHDLLLQAVVGVAAVQVIGQAAIPARVSFEIGIEQVDGHHVPEAALRGRSARRARSQCGLRLRTVTRAGSSVQKSAGFQGCTSSLCTPVAVEMLLEVSLAVQQREGDQGNAQVGGGAQRVAGQHAQAARVGGHGRIDGNFHREVCDVACVGENLVGKWLL